MRSRLVRHLVAVLVVAAAGALPARAGDWPVYLKDNARSSSTADALDLADAPAWVVDSGALPSPGFYPTLRTETLGPQKLVAPAMTHDYAYAPIVADGRLYFGSSSHEALFCYDARTGRRLWTFYAQAAVRFAPAVDKGRIYFGADDGFVYALDARSGALVWKYNAAPEDRRIIANGRIASQWPVRTGVLVADGVVYCSAGLFPADGGVYLFALNAADGAVRWRRSILTPSQGYILADGDNLIVPSGRASPVEYRAKDGAPVIDLVSDLRREGGGAFLGTFGDVVVNGPTEFGILRFRVGAPGENASVEYKGIDEDPKRAIRGPRTGLSGWRIVADETRAFFLRESGLFALPYDKFRKTLQDSAEQFSPRTKDRTITTKSGVQLSTDTKAEKEMAGYALWSAPLKGGRSLLRAPNMVVVGGDGQVSGFDPASGVAKFSAKVDGVAWEMAAADGRLYVSTSAGKVYCFASTGSAAAATAPAATPRDAVNPEMKAYAAAAVAAAGRTRGLCIVAGAGDGQLAAEIARQSQMRILCIERSADAAKKAQENLAAAGLYGARATVHVCGDGKLPYADYLANLVVSQTMAADGSLAFSAAELTRLVAPCGGTLALRGPADAIAAWRGEPTGWSTQKTGDVELAVYVRGALPGAGEWTHMFADPANTSCSGDTLVGGTQYLVQWFGDPSPPRNAGWHGNGMGPLAAAGRLFLIKIDHIEAVDAYNGTSLWSQEVAGMARFSPGREGGSACVDDKCLYVAVKNDARSMDVSTGKTLATFTTPGPDGDWGYIAVKGDLLLGTAQDPAATLSTANPGKDHALKLFWGASEPEFVVSHTLFAINKTTGKLAWTYNPVGRRLLNSTITVDSNRVYFVESLAKAVADDADGSVGLRTFMVADVFLVALDLASGRPLWEQPLKFPARTMLYLSAVNDTLVLSCGYHIGPLADTPPINAAASNLGAELGLKPADAKKQIEDTKIRFAFRALDANTGQTRWDAEYTSSDWIGTQHNYNVSHPVITEKAIYHNPAEQFLVIIDLATGKLTERREIARGKGCATPTGSARAIFYRSLGIATYDFASGRQLYVSDVSRPSCWMSVLPAGGLLLMPEYSIGCNCAFPLQTTIVLAPGQYAREPDVIRNRK